MTNKESNRDRFVRIVERRVNQILKNLDSLGKCSNKKNYEYSESDVKKIFGELDKQIKDVRAMFDGQKKDSTAFKLEA